MMAGAINLIKRDRLKSRYMGDLVWLAAKGNYSRFDVQTFGEFASLIDGNQQKKAELTDDEVRQSAMDMLAAFDKIGGAEREKICKHGD